jgi:hypothetical protein
MENLCRTLKHCDCHNICFKGVAAEHIDWSGLSHSLNKRTLVHVRNESVEVTESSEISVESCTDTYCAIKCSKCNAVLNLYYVRDNTFAQFSVDNSQVLSQRLLPQNGLENIPNVFASLIKLSEKKNKCSFLLPSDNENDTYNNTHNSYELNSTDDDDFDLMFSSLTAPIVGSYRESPMSIMHINPHKHPPIIEHL